MIGAMARKRKARHSQTTTVFTMMFIKHVLFTTLTTMSHLPSLCSPPSRPDTGAKPTRNWPHPLGLTIMSLIPFPSPSSHNDTTAPHWT